MPIEPPRKVTQTPIVRREEGTRDQQRKKKQPLKKEDETGAPKPGKVDIKV